MTKTTVLNALGLLFLVITGLCTVPAATYAAAPFDDDFDSYTVGGGNHQGSWGGNGCDFTDAGASSYPNSLICGNGTNSYYKSGTSLASGVWYFKIFVATTGNLLENITGFGNTYSEVGLIVANNGTTSADIKGLTGGVLKTINKNQWYDVGFEWTTTQYRVFVDGTWYGWISRAHTESVMGISFQGNFYGGGYVYYDTLTGTNPTPPVVAGFYPILTPTAPVSGTTNTVNFNNFNITGSISIPTDNTYIWQKLYATFTNTKGIESVTKEITLPDMNGGDSFSYSATSTIANATSTDVYEVNYSAWGYWCDPLHPEYCGKVGLSYPFEISPTFISEGSTPGGGIPPIVVSQWSPPTLEDCTVPTYSILEKLTCQIQNALLGLVIPSSASVNNLFAVFQSFQQKFPFSYVNEISTSFNTIRAALNESATISVKVFGQSGNISLAFWSQPATIGGVTTTIGATFKVILTFFLLLIFLAWGIGYLHRIL